MKSCDILISIRGVKMEEKKLKNQSRFIFDMAKDLHTEVKVIAARRNISMSLWVTRAIYEALKKEKQFDSK